MTTGRRRPWQPGDSRQRVGRWRGCECTSVEGRRGAGRLAPPPSSAPLRGNGSAVGCGRGCRTALSGCRWRHWFSVQNQPAPTLFYGSALVMWPRDGMLFCCIHGTASHLVAYKCYGTYSFAPASDTRCIQMLRQSLHTNATALSCRCLSGQGSQGGTLSVAHSFRQWCGL